MKLITLLAISAVMYILFGLGMLIAGAELLRVWGLVLDRNGALVAQVLGSALIGLAVINSSGRNAPEQNALRPILFGNFMYNAVGFFVLVVSTVSGVTNALGWSIVAIHIVLALGFGYFAVIRGVHWLMAPSQTMLCRSILHSKPW